MRTLGRFKEAYRNSNDVITAVFELENEKIISELEVNKDYFIDIDKYEVKRSTQANRYLWKLCDLIGTKLRVSKDVIYLMKLQDYGVYVDLSVREDAYIDTLTELKKQFRYIQDISIDGNYRNIRCYIGSSMYNKKEMQKLLQGTVEDARDLGIDTWDNEEIRMLVRSWKGE